MHTARAAVAFAALAVLAACGRGHAASDLPHAIDATADARSTDTIRREGNHLAGAGSIYLQEHAHNPVDWYPWSPEALARARAEDKPIFLSIGYSSCHWCHVMEARGLRERRRRGIPQRALREHQGGPRGAAGPRRGLHARTPVDERERRLADVALSHPGAEAVLRRDLPPARSIPGGHTQSLRAVRFGPRDRSRRTPTRSQRWISGRRTRASACPIAASDLHAIATSALDNVDLGVGRVSRETKFPTPVRWEFLLHAARKWGDPPARCMRSA